MSGMGLGGSALHQAWMCGLWVCGCGGGGVEVWRCGGVGVCGCVGVWVCGCLCVCARLFGH